MRDHSVLIASQRAHFRERLRDILRSKGHTVQTAADGLEALDVLRHNGFDLIVTDLDLPRMDGIELVANAKDIQRHVRIVVFHGACPKEREELLRRMGVEWVGHPETPELASRWVCRILN